MIAQFNYGSGFAGLIDYANDVENKNTNIICSEGVTTSNAKVMAACMNIQAKMNPNVKDYVGHCMLAFSPKDEHRLTDGFVEKVARDYMRRMGIVNTQFAIYRHHDQPHSHVHIVYNRVDNNGEEMKHDKNWMMSARVTQKLTREYGLTFGKGKKNVRRERLRGPAATKYRFYDTISPLLAKASSWDDFRRALEEKGFSFNLYYDKEGKARGISFSDGTTSLSGSKIDRTLRCSAVNATIMQNVKVDEHKVNEYISNRESYKDRTESSVTEHAESQVSQLMQDTSDIMESVGGVDTSIIEDAANGATSVAGAIGEAIVGAVDIATTIQPSVGGGGGSSKLDDDDEKKKKKRGYGFGR